MLASLAAAGCGGGGDGGGTTPPPDPSITQVVITSPAAAPAFGALNRTAQFTAQARDASGAPVTATIAWHSSNTAVATISGSGLVTATGNGTTNIRASVGTIQSAVLAVTVSQVPATVTITPAAVTFGAVGSTRQLTAAVKDSGGSDVTGATVTWTRSGPGTAASVSATGLVTATANGTGDSAVATAGAAAGKAPITVAQVVASITVTSSAGATPDTLKNTGSTRQFNAAARDSNTNVIAAPPAFTWNSSAAAASVNGSGLVTANADGNATISASSGAISGGRNVVVRRHPATFTIAPGATSISTNAGSQLFTGVAQDSSGANIAITWLARPSGVFTVSPAAGTTTTATAVNNGTAYLVMTANNRRDSVAITTSNQTAPVSFATQVLPIFTTNCAKAGCHTGNAPTGGMNLSGTSSQVRARLVGVATVGGPPGSIRVIAGNPDSSYIIRKLEGGPNIFGNRMPNDGPPYLSQPTIDIIRTWIAQGALDN